MTNRIDHKLIGLDQVSISDWISITHDFFPSRKFSHAEGLLLFLNNDSIENNLVLKVLFDKNHKPNKVFKGNAYTKKIQDDILSLVIKFKSFTETKIFHFPFLSCLPVEGYHAVYDQLLILPPLNQWPKDPYKMLQEKSCPFLVEFKLQYFDGGSYSQDLYNKTHKNLGHFLNLCLNSSIFYPDKKIRMDWGRTKSGTTSEYIQLGFGGSLFSRRAEEFSSVDNLTPIKMIAESNYYNKTKSLDDKQELPLNFNLFFKKYMGLSDEKRNRFELAIYWNYKSKCIEFHSQSLAFAALIFSIESLLTSDSHGQCKLCNNKIYSVSQKFRDFFKKHAPDAPTQLINKIYTVRSQISHGNRLLHSDFGTFGDHLLPSSMEDNNDYRNSSAIIRIALLNWLVSS